MSNIDIDPKLELQDRILFDELCDEFEDCWHTGTRRTIHEIANRVPSHLRLPLLRELVLTEHRLMSACKKEAEVNHSDPRTTQLGIHETSRGQSEIPKNIGPYAPKYILGAGAAGVVYAAIDLDSNEWFALKLPHSFLLNTTEGKRRFLREARNAEGLDHPNIVRFIHAGETSIGPYLVYEFLHGLDLSSYLKQGGVLSTRQKLRVISDACKALQYAHDLGVVHRDLKPSNIMVLISADKDLASGSPAMHDMSEDLQIKLLDFGIARVLESTTVMTVAGEVLGTPAYMSPEQASGQSNQANQQSDIYGIGVVLYELLTGTTPFTGTHQEVTRRISTEEVPLLSITHPSIPIPIATICNRCLRLSPRQRYAKISMVSEDIERYLEGKAISAKPVGLIEQTFSHWQRHQFSRLATVACFAAITTLLIAGTVLWRQLDELWTQKAKMVAIVSKLSPIKRWLSSTGLRDMKTIEEELTRASIGDMLALVQQTGTDRIRIVEGLERIKANDENPSVALFCETMLCAMSSERLTEGSKAMEIAEYVADRVDPNDSEEWSRFIEPLASKLASPLEKIYKRESKPGLRLGQSKLLASIHKDTTPKLLDLLRSAKEDEIKTWSSALGTSQGFDIRMLEIDWRPYEIEHNFLNITEKECLADANFALVRYCMGDMAALLGSLQARLDPRVGTYVMHRFAETGLPIEPLLNRMLEENRADVLYGLLTIYALTDREQVDLALLDRCDEWVMRSYLTHPDAGVHGMCRYLLSKRNSLTRAVEQKLIEEGYRSDRDWFVNSLGMHFAIIREPKPFWLGENKDAKKAYSEGKGYQESSLRPYAIAMNKISALECRSLIPNSSDQMRQDSGKNGFNELFSFCNWLNKSKGLDELVLSSEVNEDGNPREITEQFGYRLPTQAEWEYASRAGTATECFHGRNETPFTERNIADKKELLGETFPNRFGLFNTLGGTVEWTLTNSKSRSEKGEAFRVTKGKANNLSYISLVSQTTETATTRILYSGPFKNR